MDWLKLPTSFRDKRFAPRGQYRGRSCGHRALRRLLLVGSAAPETDWHSPRGRRRFVSRRHRRRGRAALLTAGLWKPAKDGGVHIVRFLTEQKSRAEIEQTRVDARNRKAKERRAPQRRHAVSHT